MISALLSLSQLAVEQPAILAVDINPLLVDADGVLRAKRLFSWASRSAEPADVAPEA